VGVIVWDKLADGVRALAKGDRVLVEGKLRSSTYEKALPVGVDSHRADESVGNSHTPRGFLAVAAREQRKSTDR